MKAGQGFNLPDCSYSPIWGINWEVTGARGDLPRGRTVVICNDDRQWQGYHFYVWGNGRAYSDGSTCGVGKPTGCPNYYTSCSITRGTQDKQCSHQLSTSIPHPQNESGCHHLSKSMQRDNMQAHKQNHRSPQLPSSRRGIKDVQYLIFNFLTLVFLWLTGTGNVLHLQHG